MKIYLDNCCYNRPFDDLSQDRVYLESEAYFPSWLAVKKANGNFLAARKIEMKMQVENPVTWLMEVTHNER